MWIENVVLRTVRNLQDWSKLKIFTLFSVAPPNAIAIALRLTQPCKAALYRTHN